ncbi:MAG: HD domain-containing phosphohydrolase [candidate division WOR-3 bacterium]
MKDIKKLSNSLENEELFLNTIKYLSDVIDAKDEYTIGHSERVQRYSILIGKRLGLSKKDLDVLYLASILHDIGKVKVPISILNSKRKLNRFQFSEIKRHSIYGAYLLGSFKYVNGLQEAIKHHHERYDGKGYPDGLKGKSIPLFSRIIAVADSFDAMTSGRSYKKEIKSEENAIKEIKKNSKSQFDPEIVEIFIQLYKEGYIHLEKGLHLLKMQSINSLEKSYLFLKDAKKRMRNRDDKLLIDLNIGKIFVQGGKNKDGIRILKQVENKIKDKNPKISKYELYNELSSGYYYLNEFENSLDYSFKVLKSKNANLLEKSRASRHIGMVSFKMGKNIDEVFKYLDLSREFYNRMEESFEKEKETLAEKHFSIVKYNQLINFKKEMTLDLAKYYDAKGFVYLNMGNFERSLECYLKSIDIKHFYNDLYGSIRSQSGIALVYMEQGKFLDAEYNLLESLDNALKLNNKLGLWMVYNNLGRLYLMKKNYKQSKDYYLKAYNIGVQIGNGYLLTESVFFLTRFLKSEKKKKEIVKKYESLINKDRNNGIMFHYIKGEKSVDLKEREKIFERSCERLKTSYRLLEYAKLFYNYLKFLKKNNKEKYYEKVKEIPKVIRPVSDGVVRRRLEKIYDLNAQISRDKGN